MKYYGKITDNKDLITKEYADAKIASTSSILKGDGNGNAVAATTQSATLIGIDVTPTSNSNNLITSGGVKTSIDAKYTKPASGIPASDLASGVIPTVPTNVSAFTNDAGYLTSHQDISELAPKASPALTGTPTAPTATAGTNTTQIATTAFVQAVKTEIANAITGGAW